MWIGYEFILFIIGLSALLYGAERLIDSSSSLAKRFGISPILIGITIISIGTSIPEIATSITSFISGYGDIALGNIVGSELVQITLILGLVAMVRPLKGEKKDILFYGISMIIAIFLAYLVLYDNLIYWYEGLFLILFYFGYLIYAVKRDKKFVVNEVKELEKNQITNWSRIIIFICLGIILTIIGSKLVVNSSIKIASFFGLSEYIIAVFLLGLGTSLPELVVSGIAAWKKEYGLGIGNLIGSNITDPTLSLGIGAIFVKKTVINALAPNSLIFLGGVFIFVILLFVLRKKIGRLEAIFLFLIYFMSFWLI